jgi:hypothetical protein
VVLSVQHVHLDCTSLHVNELYVIDVTDEEIPVFIDVKFIIEHDGLWVICGLLCIAMAYHKLTDSFEVQTTNDYIALSINEMISYEPVAQLYIDGHTLVYLSYWMIKSRYKTLGFVHANATTNAC